MLNTQNIFPPLNLSDLLISFAVYLFLIISLPNFDSLKINEFFTQLTFWNFNFFNKYYFFCQLKKTQKLNCILILVNLFIFR